MKKLILLLSVSLIIAVTACGNKDNKKDTREAVEQSAESSAAPVKDESQAVTKSNEEITTEPAKQTQQASAAEQKAGKPAEKVTEKPSERPTEQLTEKPSVPAFTVNDMNSTMYVISGVNVRKGPGTEYEVIGSLAGNVSVQVTGRASTGWYRISYNGGEGYCSNNYLSTDKPAEPTPQPVVQETKAPSQQTNQPVEEQKQETVQYTPVSYDPYEVVRKSIVKCQKGGMITTEDNLKRLLKEGKITKEEYDEYYPLDGMEDSYYSVFVNVDLNKATDIVGNKYGSVDAIANDIAEMMMLENDPLFNITYAGKTTLNGEVFYEFRCHR